MGLDFLVYTIMDYGTKMNNTIKEFAIMSGICEAKALDDPETFDGYKYYDKLTVFIEQVKKYYMDRATKECLEECLNICDDFEVINARPKNAAWAIRHRYGLDSEIYNQSKEDYAKAMEKTNQYYMTLQKTSELANT